MRPRRRAEAPGYPREARLRGRERIMYSKTIKVRIYSCDFTDTVVTSLRRRIAETRRARSFRRAPHPKSCISPNYTTIRERCDGAALPSVGCAAGRRALCRRGGDLDLDVAIRTSRCAGLAGLSETSVGSEERNCSCAPWVRGRLAPNWRIWRRQSMCALSARASLHVRGG